MQTTLVLNPKFVIVTVPGVPMVTAAPTTVDGTPPVVDTLKEGLAAIKPFTVKFPPSVELPTVSIDPIAKFAVESMDNSFLLVVKLKIHFSGETKVSIVG